MKNFHLIGQSIQTSLSPLIHNYLFKLKGLSEYKYSIYPKQNHLLSLTDLEKQNINGISITIPFKQSYKEDILNNSLGTVSNLNSQNEQKLISKKTAENILVKRFIINTIRKNTITNLSTQSNYDCFNTDIFGIKQCIKKNQLFSSFIKNYITNPSLSSTKAIIIGGGATAKTFMSYFQQNSIKMIVINRSVQKIQKLQKDGYYSHIQKVISFQVDKQVNSIQSEQSFKNIRNLIIINTLPTSIMRQNILLHQNNSLRQLLKSNNLDKIFYMDVNYRDSEESLFKAIQSYSKKSSNIHKLSTGLDMLVWQGIMQNYLFCEQDKKSNKLQQTQFDDQFVKIMAKLKEQGKA